MSPEDKELLRETAELVKENHKILKSMRRSARFASFLRLVYWLIILGSAFSAYYFIKPFIDPVVNGYNSIQQNIQTVKDTTAKFPSLPSWLGGKE
jgi:hypothetical protein